MRKLFFAIIVLSCFLTGCKKDCGFPYMSNDTPALKQNDYNSCEAIYRNYYYLVCRGYSEVDYPYWANDGDTIMVCGYFPKDWDGDRNNFILFDSPDNANETTFCVSVFDASPKLPEEIDISKKCYIKGHLFFNILHLSFGNYPIVPCINGFYDVTFE